MIREDVLQQLTLRYNELTKAGRRVADYVFANREKVQYLPITALAEDCGVAEATIFRFCRTLGFEGYNDFKLGLAKSVNRAVSSSAQDFELYGEVQPGDSIQEMCKKLYATDVRSIAQTLELLDENAVRQAVQAMRNAHRIYCFGQGGSMVMAMECWARFATVSGKFSVIGDSHMQAMTASLMGPEDLVLCFSYSGATKDMQDTMRQARSAGAKLVLLTRFTKSPAAALADVVVLCGADEGPLQSGSIAAKMAMLFLVDVLFNEYCRQDLDESMRNRERAVNAIANKLL